MKRLALALMLLCALPLCVQANPRGSSDGYNEILAIVDGEPITYQDVLGGRNDLSAEVRTQREVRRIPISVTDKEIERGIVYGQLDTFIVNRLLLSEARKINFESNVKDSDVRTVIQNERRLLGIADGDEVRWANYLQEKFSLTPSEYRERRRRDMIQNQMVFVMAGGQGALPTEFPLSVYFPLNVSPRDIRAAFDADREKYKVARKVDYRLLKLSFLANTSLGDRRKLGAAFGECQARAKRGESLESASSGLRLLVEQMGLPGLKLEVSERRRAETDKDLDPSVYQMVLSLPRAGGVSEYGTAPYTDEKGVSFDSYLFIQLFSKEEGDARQFSDPKVQAEIREAVYNRRLQENIGRVQQALLKRAVIIPERLIAR
ncbi:hypothetical protein EDM80_08605 [bacterium]|nr:MAG: hypothetical protein EDM80_08605 [bacterium]RIK60452.1 MAG: hypothetical protein DCC64_14735 [Planctomycetota bacterium]